MKTIKLSTAQTRDWRGAGEEHREKIKKELLEQNGGITFKLQSNTGRMLGTVHGENNVVSGAALGSGNNAPSPATCACRAYAGTPQGEHHPVCVHRNTWSQGQGITIQNVQGQHSGATHMNVSKPIGTPSGVQHFQVPRLVDGSPNPIATPATMSLRTPNDCECKAYAKPANAELDQHHFLCPYHDTWRAAHPPGPKPLPSTLDLEQKRRERRGERAPTSAETHEMRANIKRDIARGQKQQTAAQEAQHVIDGATPNPATMTAVIDNTVKSEPEPQFIAPLAAPLDGPASLAANAGIEPSDDHADTEPPPPPNDGKRYGIFDLDTRAYMREAIPLEVEEGLAEEIKTGVPIVTIDSQQYALLEIQFKPVVVEKTPGTDHVSTMRYVEIELAKIQGNPNNYRKTYQGIEKLANSIATYGLLQNLVVIEDKPGFYHVHAGERRFRAIRLLAQTTDASGKPRWEGPVRCVVITTFGLEDVVENEERASVAIWQTGARYAEEYERGVDQTTIAAKVGKTQSHVSQALRIHSGLAPKVKKMLDKIGPDALTLAQLLQLIKYKVDVSGDPDEDAQVKKCIEFLGKDRTKRGPRDNEKAKRDRIIDRVYRLENKTVPLHARALFDNIVDYLHGRRTRLKF